MATPTDPVIDGYIFYGQVITHVEAPFGSRSTFGIEVVPRIEFRVPERTPDGVYAVYPLELAADCSPEPTTADAIAERFEVGSIVGVIGIVPGSTPRPGDIDVDRRVAEVFALDSNCDVVAIARRKHNYAELDVPCGNYRFEANKDIALLETASWAERLATLERLAGYRGVVAYLDLLAKYVPDAAAGRRLLDLRYGAVAALGCQATEEDLESLEWERRARWGEYCTQDDPYDALLPDTSGLYDAIVHNRIAVVESFLSQGGDPNEPLRATPMGTVYPLKVAVYESNEPIALALLRAGADFERSGVERWAVGRAGLAQVLDYLLTQAPDRLQGAFESMGCSQMSYDVIEVLTRHALEREATITWPDGIVSNCLWMSPDSARLLLDRGAPQGSALLTAARFGSVGMVRLLIDRGADPFERSRETDPSDHMYGFAAIDFALLEYEFKDERARERVHYILHELAAGPAPKSGQRVQALARNAYEELGTYTSPADRLVFAARIGLYDAVEELVAGDHTFTPEMLRNAVRAALEGHNPDIVRLLLASGAPAGGGTLHIAAQTALAGIVKHLIALGADVEERVNDMTPLESWLLSETRADVVVQLLVMAGADVCSILPRFDDAWSRVPMARAASECAP